MRTTRWPVHLCLIAAYAAVAIAFTWPLAANLGTRLTGGTGGDTGVYVWNQWVFRHELATNGNFPYFTETLFGAERAANLSLHNYTRFQNLLAVPLMRWFSVVTTFNVIYLMMTVLTAYTTFLLARHVTGRTAESFLAGLLFAWSPLLVTRGMGHFSLVAAAPLAIFLLVLMRADGHERPRDAIALGAIIGWAASTDVYYAVYCLLIGAIFVIGRVVSIEPSPRAGHARAALWGLDVLILSLAGLIAAMVISGGWELRFLGQPLRMRSLYTPMLIMTLLGLVRLAWGFRASLAPVTGSDVWRFTRLTTAAALVGAAVMSPVLYAAALRLSLGEFATPEILWRSSPPGIDLLALVLPNPNHPLAPRWIGAWLDSRPNGFLENAVSVPLVAIAVGALAWRMGWRPSRAWAGLAVLFGLLALGPFVHIGGVNTFVAGPWAFLRYVPLLGLARSPARFSVVMMLAIAVLFALALTWLGRRYPARRRLILAVSAIVLLAELVPLPRTLHSAEVPPLYRHVAAAPRNVKLLELPFGIRSGASSVGNFTARTQFYQTAHGKTIMGGYLSRLSPRRVADLRADPVRNALAILSENQRLAPEQEKAFLARGPAFVRAWNVGFVVIDRSAASEVLSGMAIKAFRLHHVESNGPLALYATDAVATNQARHSAPSRNCTLR
jgi:hypothetical protein